MERRTEKDTHLTGLLMLGTAMGGQPINEIVDEMGEGQPVQDHLAQGLRTPA